MSLIGNFSYIDRDVSEEKSYFLIENEFIKNVKVVILIHNQDLIEILHFMNLIWGISVIHNLCYFNQ